MKLVPFESLKLQERGHARGGVFRNYDVMFGPEGSPGNFYLSIGVLGGDFVSPRHRHNFDQLRFQLEGSFDFASDGKMDPGTVAYFPEGTRYGPQKALSESSHTLVLQFGGASGNGYMSEAQFQKGLAELKTRGSFKDGVYSREKPGGGKINQDAYEAVWEHVNGRELVYPKERYTHPVFMEPKHFEWLPSGAGTAVKLLGCFSERCTRLAVHRAETGARLTLEDNSLYFAWAGSGELAGKPWRRWSTTHLEAGERAELRATDPCEVLQIGLPRFEHRVAQQEAA
jgi:hypothetical protein